MSTNKAKFLVVSVLTSALLLTSIPMNFLDRAGAAQFVVVVPSGPHAGRVVAIISLSSAAAQAVSENSGALQLQPVLSVSTLSITLETTYGSNPGDPPIAISNTGPANSVLNWSAAASAPWIGLSQASGTVAAGTSTDVVIGADVVGFGLGVGTYEGTITISDPTASNSPQTVAVTLTIAAKPITVTADAKSKVSGDADPTFTYTSSDPAATFTGALSRAPGEDVGTYAILQNNLSAGSNYAITYVGANLTITVPPSAPPVEQLIVNDWIEGAMSQGGRQKITVPATVTVSAVELSVDFVGSYIETSNVSIYAASSTDSQLGALMGTSDSATVSAIYPIHQLYSFAPPVTLSPGIYWIVPVGDNTRVWGNVYAGGYWYGKYKTGDAYFRLLTQ